MPGSRGATGWKPSPGSRGTIAVRHPWPVARWSVQLGRIVASRFGAARVGVGERFATTPTALTRDQILDRRSSSHPVAREQAPARMTRPRPTVHGPAPRGPAAVAPARHTITGGRGAARTVRPGCAVGQMYFARSDQLMARRAETWSHHSGWAYRYAAPPFDQDLVELPESRTFGCRTQELIWRPVLLRGA